MPSCSCCSFPLLLYEFWFATWIHLQIHWPSIRPQYLACRIQLTRTHALPLDLHIEIFGENVNVFLFSSSKRAFAFLFSTEKCFASLFMRAHLNLHFWFLEDRMFGWRWWQEQFWSPPSGLPEDKRKMTRTASDKSIHASAVVLVQPKWSTPQAINKGYVSMEQAERKSIWGGIMLMRILVLHLMDERTPEKRALFDSRLPWSFYPHYSSRSIQ